MARKPKAPPASAEKEAFATRLKALRMAYGASIGQPLMSMDAFAKLIDLEPETYRRYERGETEPNLRTYSAIRRVTGVNLNTLVAGEIDKAA